MSRVQTQESLSYVLCELCSVVAVGQGGLSASEGLVGLLVLGLLPLPPSVGFMKFRWSVIDMFDMC